MVSVRWYNSSCADAELSVVLDRSTYDDGDIITVHVQLIVIRAFAVYSLKAVLICSEYLEWCDSDSSQIQTHDLVNEEIELLSVGRRGQTFEPSQYDFHAKFVLPRGLPRHHYFRELCVGELESRVKSYLWVPTKLKKPKLDAGQPFTLKERRVPWLPIQQTRYNTTGSSALHLLGVRVRGGCHMTLKMNRPGIQIDGRTVVKLTIDSPQPRAQIKSAKLVLLEQAFFPLGLRKFAHGDSIRNKTRSIETAAWEIAVDDLIERGTANIGDAKASNAATVPACLLEWKMALRMAPHSVYEPMQLHLITIMYRMAVYVTFKGGKKASVIFDQVQLLRD